MAKGRSPKYPSLPLREAIEKVRLVYDKEHTHPAVKEVVATDLGYSGLNGRSLTLIGTLRRYGLLETAGDQLRVTDDAVTILELPDNSPEKAEAMERAVFSSPIFAELRETYSDMLPSDENLRHFLIKRAFLPKAATDIIRIYRDNLDLLSSMKFPQTGYLPYADAKPLPVVSPGPEPSEANDDNSAKTVDGSKLTVQIDKSGEIKLNFMGEVTPKSFELLQSMLELKERMGSSVESTPAEGSHAEDDV